jgi:hypothetical protein
MRNRNSKKKYNKVPFAMSLTLREMLKGLKYGIIEELDKIATIIQIVIPVVILKATDNIFVMLELSILFTIFARYVKEVGYKLNNVTDRGFPIPVHRFTKRDEQGFIDIQDDDVEEALLYLCDVEDYLKRKGML